MMMSFLDLSAASEDERRQIREILSDTSIVNIPEPPYHQQPQQSHPQHHQHIQPNLITTNDSATNNINATTVSLQTNSTKSSNQNTSEPAVPTSAQMPQMSGDINSVVAMDISSNRPPGYAISPSVASFHGPPPPAHVYGAPPLFQPYPPTYIIHPYNVHPTYVPYVLPPSSVVPSRVLPLHTNQQPAMNTTNGSNTTNTRSHHRSHPNHMPPHLRNHEPYSNNCNSRTNHAQSDSSNSKSGKGQVKTNSTYKPAPPDLDDITTVAVTTPRTFSAEPNQVNNEDQVKTSSDEGFDTQSSLDISKQSHESSLPNSDNQKSSPASCDKSNQDILSNELVNEVTNKIEEKQNCGNGAWSSASSKSWADLFKRAGNTGLELNVNGDSEKNSSFSENSDEDDKLRVSGTSKLEGTVKVSSSSKELRSQESSKRALDKIAPRLAQKINAINLKHSLPFLKPRGFINKGNGCYINATLQALIACPPFYNLMKEIGDLRGFKRENTCTPIIDSFAELFLNFPPLDASKKNRQAISGDQKLNIYSLQAESIEPKCIYNVLGQIKSECLKGAQEDAEEFLSSVLNGLHEEMIGLLDLHQTSQDVDKQNGHSRDLDESNDDVANDDNLWREVGPKNRSIPIRTAKVVNTPILEIFGGSLFSIRVAGKDRCGHRSPFFDLQLDISDDNVKSVQDAIKSFTAPETIKDFYCSKTKQTLDAQRWTSLDQLPPILILHLKQFVYSKDQGLKKLIKKIEYPIDFELPENCLHDKGSTDKNLRISRSYKLLAVVYHDGREAIKGHYLTDVYHIGSSQWIRCDDSNLKVVPAPRIDNPDSTRTPYLLFYRRLNTLRAQSGNHDNKKKN